MSKRILIVDDEEILLKTFSRLLAKFGYEPQTVSSGREAVRMSCDGAYDLVLCDILMPQMDGFETIQKMRQISNQKSWNKSAFVVMTGKATFDMEQKVNRLCADAVLWKPFGAHDFLDCVNHILKVPQNNFQSERPVVQSHFEKSRLAAGVSRHS